MSASYHYVRDGKLAEPCPLAITMLLDMQLFDNVYEDLKLYRGQSSLFVVRQTVHTMHLCTYAPADFKCCWYITKCWPLQPLAAANVVGSTVAILWGEIQTRDLILDQGLHMQ